MQTPGVQQHTASRHVRHGQACKHTPLFVAAGSRRRRHLAGHLVCSQPGPSAPTQQSPHTLPVEQLEQRLQALEARLRSGGSVSSSGASAWGLSSAADGGGRQLGAGASAGTDSGTDAPATQRQLSRRVADIEARLDFVERDLLRVAVMHGDTAASSAASGSGSSARAADGQHQSGALGRGLDKAAVLGVRRHDWEEDVGYDSSRAKSLLVLLLLNAGVFVAFGASMLAAGANFG